MRAWTVAFLLISEVGQLVMAGTHVSPAKQASLDQPAGSAPDKANRLIKTDLSLTDKDFIVTFTTEGEASLSLFHVYLDTDSDSSTGYQPPSRKAGEMGADYLVEGGTLHVWDGGENHAAWSWKQLDSATVGRGPAGEVQISLPLEKLKIKSPGKFRALIETLTDKWESADTLPRQGVWNVDLTKEQEERPSSAHAPVSAPAPTKAITAEVIPFRQGGKPAAAKSASLVQGSVTIEEDNLVVIALTEGEPSLTLYHIYIDSDLDVATGFRSATAVDGLGGADFLCEGDSLYAWDGSADHSAWQWRKLKPVKVTRGSKNELKVAIPRHELNLGGKRAIQLLIETINEKWEGQDVLPRQGTWRINLPNTSNSPDAH